MSWLQYSHWEVYSGSWPTIALLVFFYRPITLSVLKHASVSHTIITYHGQIIIYLNANENQEYILLLLQFLGFDSWNIVILCYICTCFYLLKEYNKYCENCCKIPDHLIKQALTFNEVCSKLCGSGQVLVDFAYDLSQPRPDQVRIVISRPHWTFKSQ